MRITGANDLPFPVETVWDALLDPAVLVRTIPGCERLETTGPDAYAMTVTAGVAAIRGTYSGSCTLADLVEHESLTMRLQGSGAPGTVDATVAVRFAETDTGTRVEYDADAVVGGMVGGVGQRMLGSVSKRMAAEFFGNVGSAISQPAPAAAGSPPERAGGRDEGAGMVSAAGPAVFTAPGAPTGGTGGTGDFARGIAVGAGLVLLGVAAGAILGRRR